MDKNHEEAIDFVASRLAEIFWEQWKEKQKQEKKGGAVITPPTK